jgi:hypothetical protein
VEGGPIYSHVSRPNPLEKVFPSSHSSDNNEPPDFDFIINKKGPVKTLQPKEVELDLNEKSVSKYDQE